MDTGISVGPVNVEFVGVTKSTWNLNKSRLVLLEGSNSITKFGVPAAGGVDPSRSDGNMPNCELFCWKHCMVAAAPVSILLRSEAQTFAPTKEVPEALKLLKVK